MTELQKYTDRVQLGEELPSIARFLNSSWSPDIPVIVTFSIVPGTKIKRVPPPVGNVIRSGLLTDSDDYTWYVALIVHEFSHCAFAEQSLETHLQIDQWLTQSRSPHRGMLNLMLNEVLGGAIGHWTREKLLGETVEFTYGQPVIRAMDEAIYPLTVLIVRKTIFLEIFSLSVDA